MHPINSLRSVCGTPFKFLTWQLPTRKLVASRPQIANMQPNAKFESESAIMNDVVSAVLSQYAQLPIAPQPGKYTVLAGFALRLALQHDSDSDQDPRTPDHTGHHSHTATRLVLLSLGAGAKCLPACRLPKRGDALHDSHAEVIARRGAVRWLLEEVQRDARARARTQPGPAGRDADSEPEDSGSGSGSSTWVCPRPDGLYALRDNVHLWMYVSTVPCTVHSYSIPLPRLRAPRLIPFCFFSPTTSPLCASLISCFFFDSSLSCVGRRRCIHGTSCDRAGPRSVRAHGCRRASSPAAGHAVTGP